MGGVGGFSLAQTSKSLISYKMIKTSVSSSFWDGDQIQ